MKYERFVETVCGENWRERSKEDLEAGYSVAMVIAFIKGKNPTLKELSQSINIGDRELEAPFIRLSQSGIFTERFNARNDPELIGQHFNNKSDCRVDSWTDNNAYMNAWGHIAAIGSGAISRNFNSYKNFK